MCAFLVEGIIKKNSVKLFCKNRHDMMMCTNRIVFVCTILYCKSVAVNPLSVSDCLSVYVVNMYCIRVQCIPLSVSVHLSVCVACTVSLFVLYFRTPFLFTAVN